MRVCQLPLSVPIQLNLLPKPRALVRFRAGALQNALLISLSGLPLLRENRRGATEGATSMTDKPVHDPWARITPRDVPTLLDGLPIRWWVAGGWARDAQGERPRGSGDGLLAAFVAEVDSRIAQARTEEEKSRLRQLRDALLGVGTIPYLERIRDSSSCRRWMHRGGRSRGFEDRWCRSTEPRTWEEAVHRRRKERLS